MTTELFYFSGTGNSFAIAKRLQKSLPNATLTPITKMMENNTIQSDAQIVGIINPVYYICAPSIVLEFLNKLNMPKVQYVFFALTRGCSIAHGAATQMKNVLKPRGYKVNSAWYFTMDQTYLPVYKIKSQKTRQKIFNNAYRKVEKVVKLIEQRKSRWEFNHADIFYPFNEKIFFKNIHNEDKKFYLNDSCNSCGTCQKICPVNNISIIDGKPHWNHACESCQACVHFCPNNAIEVMGMNKKIGVTEGKLRITHPDIKISDMVNQKNNRIGIHLKEMVL